MSRFPVINAHGRHLGTVYINPKLGIVRKEDGQGERLGTINTDGPLVSATNTTGTSLLFPTERQAIAWLWQVHAAQSRPGAVSAARP